MIFHFLQNLATRLSSIFKIPYDYCLMALNELQSTSIDSLKAREVFNETGEF